MKKLGLGLGLVVLVAGGVILGWVVGSWGRMGTSMFLERGLVALLVRVALFVAGCSLGWNLVNLDKWIAKLGLQGQLAEVMGSWQKGVRNILTVGVVTVLGVWMVTSSSSVLGWGVVLALQIRLWTELVHSGDGKGWYDNVSMTIGMREHKGVLLILAGLMAVQVLSMLR